MQFLIIESVDPSPDSRRWPSEAAEGFSNIPVLTAAAFPPVLRPTSSRPTSGGFALQSSRLAPGYNPNDASYTNASFYLYGQLSGNTNGDRSTQSQKAYFSFKPNMLSPAGGTGTVTAIRDPFGNSYGYSTAQQATPSNGFNPTFDLWSTTGGSNATDAAYEKSWIKNW